MSPRSICYPGEVHICRTIDGYWYCYQSIVFGYYIPNYLGLITRSKKEVRRHLRLLGVKRKSPKKIP